MSLSYETNSKTKYVLRFNRRCCDVCVRCSGQNAAPVTKAKTKGLAVWLGNTKMQYESKDDVYNTTAFGTGLSQNRHSVPVLMGHDAQNWNATVRIDSYRSR